MRRGVASVRRQAAALLMISEARLRSWRLRIRRAIGLVGISPTLSSAQQARSCADAVRVAARRSAARLLLVVAVLVG